MSMNILIVGVGGQGTLLASKIMGRVFSQKGFDVKVSEVHGMSQRGGSVVTYVKYSDKVFSPVINKGEADIIISFEQLESARWLPYLKKGGVLITNTQQINPMPVITGNAVYPSDIIAVIKNLGVNVIAFDAETTAKKLGSVRAVNMVLLGAAAKFMSFDKEIWLDMIASTVPEKTIEMNKSAFCAGYEMQGE